MKKMLIIAVLFVLGMTMTAQKESCAYLVQELTSDMNGVIQSETELPDGSIAVVVKLPDYFDRELVGIKVQTPVMLYKDVIFLQAWHKLTNVPDVYACSLMVGDTKFIVTYLATFNQVVFFYNKRK